MKKSVIVIVLFLASLNASAQLSKGIVEKEFPLLALPYDTKGMLFTSYNFQEPFNPVKAKFVKADISELMKKFTNTNLNINHQAKQYAIGRLNFGNRNHILYLEAFINPETKAAENQIFITSLDDEYQPIHEQLISFYRQEFQELKNQSAQIVKTNHDFGLLTEKENKLNILVTTINQEDKLPGDIHLSYERYDSEYFFDEDGRINAVYKE